MQDVLGEIPEEELGELLGMSEWCVGRVSNQGDESALFDSAETPVGDCPPKLASRHKMGREPAQTESSPAGPSETSEDWGSAQNVPERSAESVRTVVILRRILSTAGVPPQKARVGRGGVLMGPSDTPLESDGF
jgi:hypothetical protein